MRLEYDVFLSHKNFDPSGEPSRDAALGQEVVQLIANALAIQSVARITQDGKAAVDRLHRLVELMAESRLLELEITVGMFGAILSGEQRRRLDVHIAALRQLTSVSDAGLLAIDNRPSE